MSLSCNNLLKIMYVIKERTKILSQVSLDYKRCAPFTAAWLQIK